jgi:hypothetical protein
MHKKVLVGIFRFVAIPQEEFEQVEQAQKIEPTDRAL